MPSSIITTTWSDISVTVLDKRFGVVPESGSGGLAMGQTPQASATVSYYLNWGDRWTFVQQAMGSPQSGDGTPGSLVYRTPLQYTDNTALFAASFNINPILSPSGSASAPSAVEVAYRYAQVDLTYSTPSYNMSGTDAFVTIEGEAGGQEVTVPFQSYSFSDGSKPEQPVGILVPNQQITMTYHRVPYVDYSTFTGYAGTVNSATFLGLSAGYVLCNPIKWSTGITVGSLPLYEVTYSFSWRAVPWNKFLKADGTYDTLTNSAGSPVFGSTDFNALFS